MLWKSIEESVVHIQLLKHEVVFVSGCFRTNCIKRNKEGECFPGSFPHSSQHPGLEGQNHVTVFLRWRTWEQPFLRHALQSVNSSQVRFHLSSPKLLPGINTKKIMLHRRFKEIKDKPLLPAKQSQLPEIFLCETLYTDTPGILSGVYGSNFFSHQGRI